MASASQGGGCKHPAVGQASQPFAALKTLRSIFCDSAKGRRFPIKQGERPHGERGTPIQPSTTRGCGDQSELQGHRNTAAHDLQDGRCAAAGGERFNRDERGSEGECPRVGGANHTLQCCLRMQVVIISSMHLSLSLAYGGPSGLQGRRDLRPLAVGLANQRQRCTWAGPHGRPTTNRAVSIQGDMVTLLSEGFHLAAFQTGPAALAGSSAVDLPLPILSQPRRAQSEEKPLPLHGSLAMSSSHLRPSAPPAERPA